jgi:hypothetical protein
MFDPDSDIAPSGTLLGLLQRGRGDGTLHALAAPRAEALAALESCVLRDPRRDWRVESRSLYYARILTELEGDLRGIEGHLFHPADLFDADEQRTGLALSVLGHLAGYGHRDALRLLREYVARGANWEWALDELALRDSDTGLRALAPAVLDRFPVAEGGDAALARALREAYEPRPWRLWAEDRTHGARIRAAQEHGNFDRWQRQLRPQGPAPGWSVEDVLAWAQQGLRDRPEQRRDVGAARCLAAVAGPEHRGQLLQAASRGPEAARAAALLHLACRQDPQVLALIEAAATDPSPIVSRAALESFARMPGDAAVARARCWVERDDRLGPAAGRILAAGGDERDSGLVLAALRRLVRTDGADADGLPVLVDGVERLSIVAAAPLLRYLYRETSSSHLRGCAARALAATDPSFAGGFAVECLWDCEETTREIAARHAGTGDARVLAQLLRLAADPAEEAEVQTAVRGRLGPRRGAV